MCYSNHHHRFRDKAIQQFDALFYEKGNLRRCHYRIWYDLARHIWGISYKSYLSALRKDVSDLPDMPPQAFEALKALIGCLLHNAPEWKCKRYVHWRQLPETPVGQECPRNRAATLEPIRR